MIDLGPPGRFTCDSGGGFNACAELALDGLHWEARIQAGLKGWRWWNGLLLCPICAAEVAPEESRMPVRKNEPPLHLAPVPV